MRYLIIPLAIIGYLYWSYYAIKDLREHIYWDDTTIAWLCITGVFGFSSLFYLSIMYW